MHSAKVHICASTRDALARAMIEAGAPAADAAIGADQICRSVQWYVQLETELNEAKPSKARVQLRQLVRAAAKLRSAVHDLSGPAIELSRRNLAAAPYLHHDGFGEMEKCACEMEDLALAAAAGAEDLTHGNHRAKKVAAFACEVWRKNTGKLPSSTKSAVDNGATHPLHDLLRLLVEMGPNETSRRIRAISSTNFLDVLRGLRAEQCKASERGDAKSQ